MFAYGISYLVVGVVITAFHFGLITKTINDPKLGLLVWETQTYFVVLSALMIIFWPLVLLYILALTGNKYYLGGTILSKEEVHKKDNYNQHLQKADELSDNKEILVALDIVNPFTKKVKLEGLKELIRRIKATGDIDRYGNIVPYIISTIKYSDKFPDDFVDEVVEWLNHIDSLPDTYKVLNFKLDLSI